MRAGGVRPAAPCALLVLAMALTTLASDSQEKRAEMSPVPFVMGSRYGRSSGQRVMSPRNDRFFMGTRYGKRSNAPSSSLRGGEAMLDNTRGESSRGLICEYTGISTFYRCVRQQKTRFNRRSLEVMPGEDE